MGKRGPQPKPTELKKLAGNPGKRSLDAGEPQPDVEAPATPRDAPMAMRDFYRRYAQLLADLRVVTTADAASFRLMAMHYALALDAAARVRKDGLLRKDENGVQRKHPLLQVLRDNSKVFLAYAAHFGMTPSARSSVKAVPTDRQMTLEEILFGEKAEVVDAE